MSLLPKVVCCVKHFGSNFFKAYRQQELATEAEIFHFGSGENVKSRISFVAELHAF